MKKIKIPSATKVDMVVWNKEYESIRVAGDVFVTVDVSDDGDITFSAEGTPQIIVEDKEGEETILPLKDVVVFLTVTPVRKEAAKRITREMRVLYLTYDDPTQELIAWVNYE